MAGLSWLTILRKREDFRRAFLDFEPAPVARFGPRDVARLMRDQRLVRNRAKIDATIRNARRYEEIVEESGSFAAYVWRYEPRRPQRLLTRTELAALGTASPEAAAMSKDLRRRGWAFVGPTTVHSFMQAMGLINDHVRGCAAGEEVRRLRRDFVRPR